MTKKYYLTVAVLGLLITTLSVSGITSAAEGWKKRSENIENLPADKQEMMQERLAEFEAKKAEMETRKAQMETIIENEDFAAWSALMLEMGKDESFITQENFDKFIQMHNLIEEGQAKMEEARAIAEELGLPAAGNHGQGFFKRDPKGMFHGMHDVDDSDDDSDDDQE